MYWGHTITPIQVGSSWRFSPLIFLNNNNSSEPQKPCGVRFVSLVYSYGGIITLVLQQAQGCFTFADCRSSIGQD